MDSKSDLSFAHCVKSMSYESLQQAFHYGWIDQTQYESVLLYGDLIAYARFNHPMRSYLAYSEDSINMVFSYLLVRLLLFRIMPAIGAYPIAPKTRFSSELNRHIIVSKQTSRLF